MDPVPEADINKITVTVVAHSNLAEGAIIVGKLSFYSQEDGWKGFGHRNAI